MAIRALVVEDDRDLQEALLDTLSLNNIEGHGVIDAESAVVFLKKQSVDIVVTDVNMPGMDGHQLLALLRQQYPTLPVLLMTAYGQVEKAVEAIRQGAVDYLMKPFEPDSLIAAINTYATGEVLDSELPIAEAPSSQQLLQLAQRVAATDSTVLITGESGTGKEVLARYIHQQSPRANKPFVAINCAAIPENMLEATLFGHEKGAFTGAISSSPGKFEQANGGTLLLDEVTEMALGLQAKLLRVLQEQEVERVGGRATIKLDVRVLATSNRALADYVADGEFREDLYYRLNVFPLQWHALRDRREDIAPLAERILAKHAEKMRRPGMHFSPEALARLSEHSWPGNVRELDNAVQRAMILQPGNQIGVADLHLDRGAIALNSSVASPVASSAETLEIPGKLGSDMRHHEFQLIIDALKATGGSRKEAAERLDISPRTLRYKLAKIREAGIDLDQLLAS